MLVCIDLDHVRVDYHYQCYTYYYLRCCMNALNLIKMSELH